MSKRELIEPTPATSGTSAGPKTGRSPNRATWVARPPRIRNGTRRPWDKPGQGDRGDRKS